MDDVTIGSVTGINLYVWEINTNIIIMQKKTN
jgi:hypothetical protein